HRASIEANGIALHLRVDPDVYVDGDATRLAQVVTNLLGNAAKFTPRGGHINVELSPGHDECVLRVRDTGVGIDPTIAPHLFEPFSQGAQALDRARGGLGLGLSMVKGLVELHRGKVAVVNQTSGPGTVATVTLPRLGPPQPAVPIAEASKAPPL